MHASPDLEQRQGATVGHEATVPVPVSAPRPRRPRRVARGVVVIAALKLTGALLLTIAGLGALHLVQNDAVTVVESWIQRFGGDLDGGTARRLLARVAGFPTERLEMVGAGALGYALMLITQGIGLLRSQVWAEWLTVLVTASFIPIECYEIAVGSTAWKLALLVVNGAIVLYLVRHLRRRARERARLAPSR